MKRYALAFTVMSLLTVSVPASACPRSLGCGCHLALKLFGTAPRILWSARAWLGRGERASVGCIGCVAVFSRGRGGHVGIVRDWHGDRPVVYSWGNAKIGWFTHEYPRSRLLGLRDVNARYSANTISDLP